MMIQNDRVYSYIGGQIRERRNVLGLTQEQVAQRLGLRRTSITNIEAGRQKLPLDLLYQLCAILDLDVTAVLPPMQIVLDTSEEEEVVAGIGRRVPPRTALLVRTLREQLGET